MLASAQLPAQTSASSLRDATFESLTQVGHAEQVQACFPRGRHPRRARRRAAHEFPPPAAYAAASAAGAGA